jgi:hypothetical protein
VPPDQVDVNVTDCPLSIVGFKGMIVGVPSAEFTVTDTVGEEVAVAVGVAPTVVPVSVKTT